MAGLSLITIIFNFLYELVWLFEFKTAFPLDKTSSSFIFSFIFKFSIKSSLSCNSNSGS